MLVLSNEVIYIYTLKNEAVDLQSLKHQVNQNNEKTLA